MQKLFLIDVTRGFLPATLLTAAAYAAEGGEAMLVQGVRDHEVVRQTVERFRPAKILAMPGCAPNLSLGTGGDDAISVETLPHDEAPLLAWLIYQAADQARGAVLFPAHSPSWAIKAAALAVRLGYLAWPLEEAAGLAYAAPADIPLLVLGEAPGSLRDALQGRDFRHLSGDKAIAECLREHGLPVDYAVLVNSADLEPPAYTDGSFATTWTQGLSLLAPVLASYRNAVVLDARTPRADSKEIERSLNQKVAEMEIRPEYLAVLASPGAIPFIHEPLTAFGAGEDPSRDIHLRLNDDLYFDCAEGRLLGATAGKVSLQILSTKHYATLTGAYKKNALIFNRPHVEGGVIFAIDEAVGRTQLKPLLETAGLTPTELYDLDCAPAKIAEHLPNVGLALYGGHGSQGSLSTHEAPLSVGFLPANIAPGVVYACACSTLYPKPARFTADGGYSCDEEVTPFAEQIGPAFVDRGALAFIGGLTVEDVLLNTPMYVVFAQALVLKGLPVGHAVRAARNHTLTHLAVLSQRAPGAYADYRSGLANTIQQQVLLGDPAFRPYAGTTAARLPQTLTPADDQVTLKVTLPEDRWVRRSIDVHKSPANKEFHRARSLEAWLPVGEDVYNWGENYTVAKDASDLSDKGLMGSYLHLTADLPAGRVPTGLTLEEVEASPRECLLCGETHEADDALAKFRSYVIPFQGSNPPVKYDNAKGWAFTVEETATGLRVHWLVPALVIDDPTRQAIQLRSATFALKHAPGVKAEGRLDAASALAGGRHAPGAMEGTRGHLPPDLLLSFGPVIPPEGDAPAPADKKLRIAPIAQVLTGPGGRWSCWLPKGAELGVKVDLPMPVYRHAQEAVLGFVPETLGPVTVSGSPVNLALKAPDYGTLHGVVVDAFTGKPLNGARVRIWRGKSGPRGPVLEGYVAELKADAQGRFELHVPTGGYVVATAHRTDLRYLSGRGSAQVFKDRTASVLVSMEPGAVVTGKVECQGRYQPAHVGVKLVEHGNKDEKVITAGRTRRDGTFEILVSAAKPFDILIHPEGFARLLDSGDGEGYHPAPGDQLERSFTIQGE